jgi:hypothetical protein
LASKGVAVWHDLATMVLSSLYMVSLHCSCGWDCQKHEFLDLREYHGWLNYDVRCRRTHWLEPGHLHSLKYRYTCVSVHYTLSFIQCTVTRATPGTETYTTTPGSSQDWSLQLYGATPGTLSVVRLTQATTSDRSLQLYGTTPGTEMLPWHWEKPPPVKTCTLSPKIANHP